MKQENETHEPSSVQAATGTARPAVPDTGARRPLDPRQGRLCRPCGTKPGAPLPAEPLVKWVGGKRNLLPQLEQLMPDDVAPDFKGRLVEPFAGGLAVFFHLRPEEAILSDLNGELVNFYLQVRDNADDLLPLLDALARRPYTPEVYYEVRSSKPTSRLERAARFLYLNKYGFNGLYRENSRGEFNVSFGRSAGGKAPTLYDQDNIMAATRLLQRAELLTSPFERTLKRVNAGDFVFLDPPYEPISPTSAFTGYTKAGFSLKDQVRLRDAILRIHRRTGGEAHVMMSNSVAPRLLELYAGRPELCISRVNAQRAVSAKASSRGGVPEVVVTNYPVREGRAA